LKYKYLVGMLALCGTATVARAETKCSISRIAELPVTMAGLRPEVRVKINGKDVVFLADSGAWYSMISPGSAAELGLKLQVLPPGYFNVGVGGSFVPKYTIVDSFTIAGVKIPRVEFLVGGSEFGTVGLLGQNVLAIEDTEFDLANGMIRLMRTRNCGKSPIVYWAGPEVNFSVVQTESMPTERPHIIAPIYINGIKLRALFDTGASSSFVSLKAAARAGLKPDTPGVTPAGVSSGLGRSLVSTWVGPVASIRIGDEEIRNTRLRFGGDLDDVDMLVGADFFLSHHVYWSNTAQRMSFTFNGGHVFDLRYLGRDGEEHDAGPASTATQADPAKASAAPAAPGATPTDAEGFSRRGAARSVRGDLPGAFADLNQAIKLAPDNIEFLRQRAVLHERMRQPLRAVEDIDRLLKLKPDDADAHMMRAAMRLRLDHKADVTSDLEAAAGALSNASDKRFALAELYQATEDYQRSIPQYDLWIAVHPDDSRRPMALNARCWARAMLNVDLDRALKDCNAALSASGRNAAVMDSRGMVRLRMGDYARAIADYDEALKAAPDVAWSYYGRGIAKLRLGKAAEGEADIAKAKTLDADLADEAKKRGIAP
jgi:tetratricopeptide (TPR) repeat protein/predicted aspartyl protease